MTPDHLERFPTWERVEQRAHLVDEHEAVAALPDYVMDHAMRHSFADILKAESE